MENILSVKQGVFVEVSANSVTVLPVAHKTVNFSFRSVKCFFNYFFPFSRVLVTPLITKHSVVLRTRHSPPRKVICPGLKYLGTFTHRNKSRKTAKQNYLNSNRELSYVRKPKE